MSVPYDIAVESHLWQPGSRWEALVARVIDACAATGDALPDREISVLLADDAAVRALNRQWRGIDKATNVLSFPAGGLCGANAPLGDIVIAYETTAREAHSEGKTLNDHVAHLLVHGVLHLVGDDHETAAEAERMEARERAILAALGIADPYEGSEPLVVSGTVVPAGRTP